MDHLQEAYLSVYEANRADEATNDELDEGFKRMNRDRIERQARRLGGDKGDVLRDVAAKMDTPTERQYSTSQARRNRAGGAGSEYRKRQELRARDDAKADFEKYGLPESVDLYDVILSHLLDEGFADTEKNAITIMANMSEAWIDTILEKADNTIRLVYGKGGKGVPINDGSGNVLRKPNVGFAQQGRDFKMATSAADERASWAAGERGKINRRNAARLQNAHKKSIQQLNAKSGDGDYDAPEGHHYDTKHSDRAARKNRASGR